MKIIRLCAIGLAVLAAACSYTSEPVGSAQTRILLTDDPFPYNRIAHVNIHIVRVQTSPVADSVNATWTTVAAPDSTIDVLSLQSGNTALLGLAKLDATTIGAVRIVINTSLSTITDTAGQPVTVHWPVQGELPINAYVQASLADFVPGTPHNLVIDFDLGRSFEDVNHDGSLYFLSWVRALDDAGTGSVAGVIRGPVDTAGHVAPLANAAVTILSGNPMAMSPMAWFKIATGRTDAQGNYRIAYVYGGTYIVRVEPLGVPTAGCADTTGIVVTAGATTTLNVTVPLAPGSCVQTTGGGGGPDTNGVTVDQTVANVSVVAFPPNPVVGDSIAVRANLTNAAGQTLYGKATSWAVSDTTVVGITWMGGQNLLLRARKQGTAVLTATSESITGQLSLTVQ